MCIAAQISSSVDPLGWTCCSLSRNQQQTMCFGLNRTLASFDLSTASHRLPAVRSLVYCGWRTLRKVHKGVRAFAWGTWLGGRVWLCLCLVKSVTHRTQWIVLPAFPFCNLLGGRPDQHFNTQIIKFNVIATSIEQMLHQQNAAKQILDLEMVTRVFEWVWICPHAAMIHSHTEPKNKWLYVCTWMSNVTVEVNEIALYRWLTFQDTEFDCQCYSNVII